jgi:outer membrane protein TolC
MKLELPVQRRGTRCPRPIAVLLIAVAAFITGCVRHDSSIEEAAARTLAAQQSKSARLAGQPIPAPTSTVGAPATTATTPATAKSGATMTSAPAPRAPSGPDGFIDPLTKSGERINVTLDECLRRTLANNLGIQIARFNPPIARTAVTEAKAIFDPSWFLNSAVGRLKEQSPSLFTGAGTLVQRQWTLSTGLQDRLPTGATVQLSQDWTYLKSNNTFTTPNPQFDAHVGLSVTQPLLRGAGIEVNTSPIVLARFDEKISIEDFRLALMNTLFQVETAYWSLVVAETQVQAINDALEAARENLRIVQRRFEEGKEKRVVVSLATSAVTSRQADLVVARLSLARTSDLLKRLMNDPQLPLTQPVVLAAAECPISEPVPVGMTLLERSILVGLQNRPEIRQAEARLSQADLRERVARNGELPQVDLVAGYGLHGLGSQLGDAFDKEFTAQFNDWSAGLNVSLPIGNRGPRAVHQRSRFVQDQTLLNREDVRQQIALDISEVVRDLASAEEAILATRAAREAAEQTVHDMEAFVSAGAALIKDLLDAQRDLADAKVREMQAMSGYMVSLAALQRAQGTLLEYNHVEVLPDVVKPPAEPRTTR